MSWRVESKISNWYSISIFWLNSNTWVKNSDSNQVLTSQVLDLNSSTWLDVISLVLTDHNNLKSFMNIQKLNEKQVRWIMRLLICNFEIIHKSEKTNSINVSSRWFNYKNENIFVNHLLLILQRKLTRIKSLNSFIFVVIRELYCIQVINDVEKMFVHSISMNRYSAEHVESRLQDETHW